MNFFQQAAEKFSSPEDRLFAALQDKSKVHGVRQIVANDKADVSCRDEKQRTPMHIAACNGYWDLAQLFAELGAPVNAIDDDGQTPLHYACRYGFEKTVRTLLQLGADTEIKDKNDKQAGEEYEVFISEDTTKRIRDTLNRSRDPAEKLCEACRNGDMELIQQLVPKTGLGPEVRNWIGDTPLQCAAATGQLQVIEYLLQNGVTAEGHDGNLALGLAIAASHNAVVVKLMQTNPNLKPLPTVTSGPRDASSQCCQGGILGWFAKFGGVHAPKPAVPKKREGGIYAGSGVRGGSGIRSNSRSRSAPYHRRQTSQSGNVREGSMHRQGSLQRQGSRSSSRGHSRENSKGSGWFGGSEKGTPKKPNIPGARPSHRVTSSEPLKARLPNAFHSRLATKSQDLRTR